MRIPEPAAGRRKARIEIIPLIDIMFFLLATFMMVSLSMIESQGMKVKLPVAQSTAAQKLDESVLSLTVDAQGRIYVDKKETAPQDLGARLAAYRDRAVEPRVLINADEGARWQSVVKALDETRLAGISQVAILTQAGEGKAAP